MSEATHIENLKKGDRITVLNWAQEQETMEVPTPMGVMQAVKNTRDDAFMGDVLEVMGVNPPYVAVKILSGPYWGKKHRLDTRKCKLIHINKEYVDALTAETLKPEKQADKPSVAIVDDLNPAADFLRMFVKNRPKKKRSPKKKGSPKPNGN